MTNRQAGRAAPIVVFAVLALVALLGYAAWRAFATESVEKWIRENDTALIGQLNKATLHFQKQEYGEAALGFEAALTTAARLDREAAQKWKEYKAEIPQPRKFFDKSTALSARNGLTYFKNRMADASLGLTSSLYRQLQRKYGKEVASASGGDSARPTIPPNELNPALRAADDGLAASPQSESLRLLRAEILTFAGKYAEAITTLNDLLLVSPNSAEANNQLGLIYSAPSYMEAANYEVYREKALAAFEKAALLKSIDGKYLPDPHFNLGIYYATPAADQPADSPPSKADAQKALLHLRRYLEIAGPQAPQAAIVKSTITRLERGR